MENNKDYEYGNIGAWEYERRGKSWFFTQTVTYAGVTQNVDLDFFKGVRINRVEQIWNDATAKDFSIRMFTVPSSATYYSQLQNLTGNIETSEVLQLGSEYEYPAGTRMRFAYANYTAGKIVKIIVQATEI